MDAGHALSALLEPVRQDLQEVEDLMARLVADVDEPLGSGLRHVLAAGKRLRPALVLLCGRLFVPPDGAFYRLAAAVEMLHTATLIHDDLVDGAPLRRGRATLHTLWPAGAAVLAGDHLMALAVGLVADLACPRLVSVFAGALGAMSGGEIRQLLRRPSGENARQEYYRRAEAKTASLCAVAAQAAGILAGGGEVEVAALREYGLELGLAFQIADDVLDLVGNERVLGKPAGTDVRQGNLTLPTILYLEDAGHSEKPAWNLWPPVDEQAADVLIEAVRASPAVGLALAEAHAHARAARRALAALPDVPARWALDSLATFVVMREH